MVSSGVVNRFLGSLGSGTGTSFPWAFVRRLDLLEVEVGELGALEDRPALHNEFHRPTSRCGRCGRSRRRASSAWRSGFSQSCQQLLHPRGIGGRCLGWARLSIRPGTVPPAPGLPAASWGNAVAHPTREHGDQRGEQDPSCSWHGPSSSLRTARPQRAPATCGARPDPSHRLRDGPYHSWTPTTSAAEVRQCRLPRYQYASRDIPRIRNLPICWSRHLVFILDGVPAQIVSVGPLAGQSVRRLASWLMGGAESFEEYARRPCRDRSSKSLPCRQMCASPRHEPDQADK